MEETKLFNPGGDSIDGAWHAETCTLRTIEDFMKEHDIPADAVIRYAGCGSHMIEFAWEVEDPDSLLGKL